MLGYKIGMPALVELDTFTDTVDLCRELKLDFIELNMNLPSNFIQQLPPNKLSEVASQYNLFYTMHMPDDADMGSFFDPVRRGFVQLAEETIQWASRSNVRLLNFHLIEGAKMTLPHKKIYVYEQYDSVFINQFMSSFTQLSKIAKQNNLYINVENSGNFGKAYAQSALKKVLALPNVGITWDTGHDTANNMVDHPFLMANQSHITHMHLHDTLGAQDHLVLFKGEADIFKSISFAKTNQLSVVVEVKTIDALRESIYELRQRDLI
jgi:sugar phosphate isomerase/epimerase